MPDQEKYFAAFIMTYERPGIISDTIEKIFNQTQPPQKILVVDNSISSDTKKLIEGLNNPKIEYHGVGENIGPAGASKIGLEKLTEQGYKWIYWVDDDDPPFFSDTLERLLKCAARTENVGIVGAAGQYFNFKKGMFMKIPSENLSNEGDDFYVDSVAGNMTMVVNSSAVRAGAIPDSRLFFGLEELDFCLKVKELGYKIVVPREVYYHAKKERNKIGVKSTKPNMVFSPEAQLWRSYYSRRNLIVIIRRFKKNNSAAVLVSMRAIFKTILGFKKGFSYGFSNAKMELLAVFHGWSNITGMKIKPRKK